MPQTSTLRPVQVERGTYEVRRIVTREVRDQLRQGEAPEREPLTWEEYLSLPPEQRHGGGRY